MFKIISKRKYEALVKYKEESHKGFEELYNKALADVSKAEADAKAAMGYCKLLKRENKELSDAIDKHKTLYADELQKRLDLAAKVRDVETHNEELQEKLFRTEKDLSEVKASISAKERAVQVTTAGNIIRMLELGVVEDGFAGTFCKDVDVIIKHIRKRFIP